MRVAIIHDWLNQYGGAEKVLEILHDMYPGAPVYTSMYAPESMPKPYREWDIRTSFMQRLPLVKRHHQPFLALYPLAFESFDLSDYELVISNSSGFCHGAVTPASTCHVNYCLTPPRFLWNFDRYMEREKLGGAAKLALAPAVGWLRAWDTASANRVDRFVGISRAVVSRIRKIYRREAALLYPPVDTGEFRVSGAVGDYFLIVSRLIPYKRVDLAVRAFTRLGLPLVVVGSGRDRREIEATAGGNVRFTGWLSSEDLKRTIAGCRAFIFPGEEDFGIAPVEAMAAGRPVIAYAGGGALETVIPGLTGELFYERTPEALEEVLATFKPEAYDPEAVARHARSFDTSVFREGLRRLVAVALEAQREGPPLDTIGTGAVGSYE